MTTALPKRRMPQWMKVDILSSDGFKTKNSWGHNSHSFSTKSPQTQTNARMNTPPRTKPTNRGSSVAQTFTATRKATKTLIAEQESGNSLRMTYATRSLANDGQANNGHNEHRRKRHKRDRIIIEN